jgi:hypothetical protein
MKAFKSQKEAVLAHLQQYGHITPLKALAEYGCMRLAAVINELRNEGVAIETLRKDSVSRITGKKVYYADYTLT